MGLEAQYLYNAYSMDSAKMVLQMLDTEADAFKLNVDATQGDDWVHAVNLSVPVLLGMEYRRFYFLVGPKFSLNMWNQMQAQAQMVTTATYDKYIDDFANMPNHELGNYVLESEKAHANWTVDIIAHAEIGYRFGDVSFETGADIPKPKQRFYVALFVDYGLLNLNNIIFPVDKWMKFLTLMRDIIFVYPFSFAEFVSALGGVIILDHARNSLRGSVQSESAHEKLLEYPFQFRPWWWGR